MTVKNNDNMSRNIFETITFVSFTKVPRNRARDEIVHSAVVARRPELCVRTPPDSRDDRCPAARGVRRIRSKTRSVGLKALRSAAGPRAASTSQPAGCPILKQTAGLLGPDASRFQLALAELAPAGTVRYEAGPRPKLGIDAVFWNVFLICIRYERTTLAPSSVRNFS
ncbi:hypothetical protein EVAR_22121_1 [Eumeta japonica]|uniref:Uncharacterized protein n=1 Tax=Eumeta variegata TaxID=151549 RepID=A0A4C1W288_EUMVA|nr:hypothetical protein EVAR_22121_1 [Eumeta japonica]